VLNNIPLLESVYNIFVCEDNEYKGVSKEISIAGGEYKE
jgi:hypothetical protein